MKPGILIEIPGFGKLELRAIVSDYSGTHSRGGKITHEVERRLIHLWFSPAASRRAYFLGSHP